VSHTHLPSQLHHPRNYLAESDFPPTASRTVSKAQSLTGSRPNTIPLALDVTSPSLPDLIAAHDLVVSLVPFTHHATIIRAAIAGRTHVVTTSYVSPAMRALDAAAREAGIVVLNEVGLDPGIDHLYAVKTIGEVHARGGRVREFYSYCGGLPAPECADNPLKFKVGFSLTFTFTVDFTFGLTLPSHLLLCPRSHPRSAPPHHQPN
jgi:saccharopine dehydrogenase-like NADP-dependent oxidoreductase